MYEIKILTQFAAAHRLENFRGKCESLHGHNWKVEVYLVGRGLDEAGLLLDFGEVKAKANELLSRARSQLQGFPATARSFTEKVQKGNETLYRARFAGLEEDSAQSACKALKRAGFACFTTKN